MRHCSSYHMEHRDLDESSGILDRAIKDAVTGTNACFSGSAEDLTEKSVAHIRRISKANSRRKVGVLGWPERAGYSWVSWNHQAQGSTGEG